MYFQLGTRYVSAVGEVEIVSQREFLNDAAGRQYAYTDKWTLMGEMQQADGNTATLQTRLVLLENAFNPAAMRFVPFAGLFYGGGGLSHYYWNAYNSTSGIVAARGPAYPQGRNTEHANCRTYQIELQCTFELGGASPLLDFKESLRYKGNGGARIAAIETRNTEVVYQTVSQRTPVYLIQSGHATGRFSYPLDAVPFPVFPDYLQNPDDEPEIEGPGMTPAGVHVGFTVRWSYLMILPRRVLRAPRFFPR